MPKPPRSLLDGNRLAGEVLTDEDFEKNRRNGDLCHAFTQTALALAALGTFESGARTKSADQLNVSARIPHYIVASSALSAAEKGEKLSYNERKSYVRTTVMFNHALAEMIDSDPSASFGEVRNFLMGVYDSLYTDTTPQSRQVAKARFEQTLTGMTSEIIGEQLAGYLGYDIEDASVEDDMRGIDRFITVGGIRYGVDFKASSVTANKARTDHPRNFIVSTTVPDDVVGGKLRLPPEDVAHYAPFFQKELERELNRHSSVV